MTDRKTVAEMRLMARLVREYDYTEISRMLRKAADELEQVIAATLGSEQPCFATKTGYKRCKYSTNRGWCDDSRYTELFGTPEKVADMLSRAPVACSVCLLEDECIKMPPDDACCLVDNKSTLLEWLRGKAVKNDL